jgi:hypothetical protein
MRRLQPNLLLGFIIFHASPGFTAPAVTVLDAFENLEGWSVTASEGVRVEMAQDQGHTGMGMRLDFDFQGGGGFVIARKAFTLPLPDNYAFSFRLRAAAPDNNFEFKVIDPSGENVWWRNQRNYRFPADWQRITVQKRHLSVAWGATGGMPQAVGALEFAISVGSDGRGSLWLDDLQFEARDPVAPYTLTPAVRASTFVPGHDPRQVLEQTAATGGWRSGALAEEQWLMLDFLQNREYGGLVIDWGSQDYATAYQVQTSVDGESWQTAYELTGGNGGRDYIYLPDTESRYLRLDLRHSSRAQGYAIEALRVQPIEFSASLNQFFTAIARAAPRGAYPRYFNGEQTYWTVLGVDGDDKEALLNEEGMLEVDKGAFSVEPFLYVDGRLITWNDVGLEQHLEQAYLPIASVRWKHDLLTLDSTAFAAGEPGAATLYARYRISNPGVQPRQVRLYLALRPFQVNPPWQNLNMAGGVAPIRELAYRDHTVWVNGERAVVALTPADRFGAAAFDQGPITDYLTENRIPAATALIDPFGFASGVLQFGVELPAGGAHDVTLAIPFHDAGQQVRSLTAAVNAQALLQTQQEAVGRHWRSRLERVDIQLPPVAADIINTLKSALAHILINRDGPALQPGSRCYDRSWMRDGALTSAALLGLGYTEEVREFLQWFAGFQGADGRIPCCVDERGADGVAEHDSHGEFIYAVAEYYRYTRDVGFLSELWPHVTKAVGYIDSLRQQRLTPAFTAPDKLPFYGLVPESISHEGYAAHPVHSYWDDFFVLRGLKDAADLAAVLGEEGNAARFAALRDAFQRDLLASLERTMNRHGIGYLPASVELGDFDPTATAIAVAPGEEQEHLPRSALQRTFEAYYNHFLGRRDGGIEWQAYTPYEIRIVGAFVRLEQRRPALEALRFFLGDRRPAAWNQWAEVVWKEPRAPHFIGDMPHTWVGSEYLRVLRTLFAFEREADAALVLAAGIPREWVESPQGVTVKRLPTYYGALNYSLRQRAPGEWVLNLAGDVIVPPGQIVVKPPLPRPLRAVTVNGKTLAAAAGDNVRVGEFPAEVVLRY